MTKFDAPSRVNAQTVDLPIAHIDAQDIQLSLSVQEYLELNGCAVVVNRKPAVPAVYHIVIGDEEYVKETLALSQKKSIQTFAIIYTTKKKQTFSDLGAIHAKIAVVSASSIGTRETQQLFAYFFTGGDDILYLDGTSPLPVAREAVAPVAEKWQDERREEIWKEPAPHVDTATRISATIDELFGVHNISPTKTPRMRKKFHLPTYTSRRVFVSALVFIASFIVIPVCWYLLSIVIAGSAQWYVLTSMKTENVGSLGKAASITSYWIGQGKRSLRFMSAAAGSVGREDLFRNQERILSVVEGIAGAEEKAARLLSESTAIMPMLFSPGGGRETESLLVSIGRLLTTLEDLTNSLGLVNAELEVIRGQHQFPMTLSVGRVLVANARTRIDRAVTQVSHARNLLALYRAAGGFDGKKTYLILLQNSMELRPTGGFIGSIATVNVEDGISEVPAIQDVYAVDGQLKGHVDPPKPIAELLEQEHWYLRDSNWDPDFAVSGEKAAWFYEKETGVTVDGVIAVSTPVLTDLLGALGPVELPDYNDHISKDNFFGKSLFYTKADFFPGSTQKKDFLGSLGTALLGRLISVRAEEGQAVFLAMSRALEAGDVQFWFPGRKTQALVEQAGWAGTLSDMAACEQNEVPCTVNRIALVESNMGVNKVNAYMTRTMKARVDIDEQGLIDGSVTVAYQKTSTDDAALSGGGIYLAYLRAFVPAEVIVVSALIDGKEVPIRVIKASNRTLPYRDTDETGRGQTGVALAFTVPPLASRTITIRYQMERPLTFVGEEGTYLSILRKQPGIPDTGVDLAIGYPSGWKAETDETVGLSADNGFLANAKEVRYNTTLDQTKKFVVKFRKQKDR